MKRIMVFLNFVLFFVLSAGIISVKAQNNAAHEFTQGFNIYAYHLENGKIVSELPLPAAELGYFTAEKSYFLYEEPAKRLGIPLEAIRLIRCMGYLYTDKPTKVVFIIRSQGITGHALFVNKKLIIKNFGKDIVDTPTVILEKAGLYEVDMRIYGGLNKKKEISYKLNYFEGFDFKIKTEDFSMPAPAHTVLVLPIKAQ